MRPQVCWRPNTTILRSLFFLHTHVIPKKRKKTSHCSMSTRSQSASSAGKFETQAQILAMRPQVATGVLILQSLEVFFFYAPMSFQRTEKRLLIVVWALEAIWLLAQENLRPEAQILAMRPQVCWRPNTTILRSLFSYSPSTVKIEANSSVSSGSLSCDLGSKK